MFSHHSAHAHRPTFITSTPSNTGLAHHYAHAHGVCPLGKLESYLTQHHTLAWMEYRTPSSCIMVYRHMLYIYHTYSTQRWTLSL